MSTCRLLTLLACAAILTSACTRGGRGGGGPRAHADGTLRVAMSYAVNTLNPVLMTQETEANIAALMFDPLIATDEHGRDVPILAREVPTLENGGIARDGLTITYHLRRGVRWHDGAPFSSHDVAFTIAAIDNPRTLVGSRHGYDDIASVTTPDVATAVIHLKHRFAPAVDTFFATSDSPYFIIPAHLLERYADLNRVPFDAAPVGTGPFRFSKWLRGDRVEMTANDGYFLGRPHLRKIVVRYVPDENTIVNELETREIDWFAFATPHAYEQLRTLAGYRTDLVPTNGYDAIEFNVTHPPFDDARVRRAFGLALDKAAIVRDQTFGSAVPAREDLPPFLWAQDPHAGTDLRDLAGAKRLLEAAGWRAGPGGIRMRGGQRLAFQLAYRNESATDRGRGVLVAAMLREAGMEATLKGYISSLYYASAGGGGILALGRYDSAFQTWYSGIDPDDSTQLLCNQVAPAGYNWARYCNPAMDAAQAIALSRYDRPTRTRAYATIERLLARDAPFVYLWWPRQIETVTPALKNFRPNGIIETWNAYRWSF